MVEMSSKLTLIAPEIVIFTGAVVVAVVAVVVRLGDGRCCCRGRGVLVIVCGSRQVCWW